MTTALGLFGVLLVLPSLAAAYGGSYGTHAGSTTACSERDRRLGRCSRSQIQAAEQRAQQQQQRAQSYQGNSTGGTSVGGGGFNNNGGALTTGIGSGFSRGLGGAGAFNTGNPFGPQGSGTPGASNGGGGGGFGGGGGGGGGGQPSGQQTGTQCNAGSHLVGGFCQPDNGTVISCPEFYQKSADGKSCVPMSNGNPNQSGNQVLNTSNANGSPFVNQAGVLGGNNPVANTSLLGSGSGSPVSTRLTNTNTRAQ